MDDLAEAVVFLMENVAAADIYKQNISHINIGTGEDMEIGKLAELIKKLVGYDGKIEYDTAKPDGNAAQIAGRFNTQ